MEPPERMSLHQRECHREPGGRRPGDGCHPPPEPEGPDTPGTDPTPDAPADEPKNDTMTFVAAIAVIVVIVLLVVMISDREPETHSRLRAAQTL